VIHAVIGLQYIHIHEDSLGGYKYFSLPIEKGVHGYLSEIPSGSQLITQNSNDSDWTPENPRASNRSITQLNSL